MHPCLVAGAAGARLPNGADDRHLLTVSQPVDRLHEGIIIITAGEDVKQVANCFRAKFGQQAACFGADASQLHHRLLQAFGIGGHGRYRPFIYCRAGLRWGMSRNRGGRLGHRLPGSGWFTLGWRGRRDHLARRRRTLTLRDLFLAAFQPVQQAFDCLLARFGTRQTAVIHQQIGYLLHQSVIGFVYCFFTGLIDPKCGKLANTAHHCLVLKPLLRFQA